MVVTYFAGYRHRLEDGDHVVVNIEKGDSDPRVTLSIPVNGFAALTPGEAVQVASSLLRARGLVEEGWG